MYQLRKANENDYNFTFNLFKTVYEDYVIKFWSGKDNEFEKDFYKNRFKPEKTQIILVNGEYCIEALKEQGINKVALVAFRTNKLRNFFWKSQGFEDRNDLVYRNKRLNDNNI